MCDGLHPLAQEFQKELSQWRKDPSGSKKKPKYSYKTVEELKAKGRTSKKLTAPQKELSQVKVRGPRHWPGWGAGNKMAAASGRTGQRLRPLWGSGSFPPILLFSLDGGLFPSLRSYGH